MLPKRDKVRLVKRPETRMRLRPAPLTLLLWAGVVLIMGGCIVVDNNDPQNPSLKAAFNSSPASPAVGQAVQFTDTSTGSPTSWQWNFNDGTTSTGQNPSHSFSASGSYAVTLTVGNGSGSNSVTQVINVMPSSTLSASFSLSPVSPAVGQAVQFTDTSTGSPTSWQWNFGDGTSSTARNPSHSYTTVGTKTVTLNVNNGLDSSSVNRTIAVVTSTAIIVNHTSIKLNSIPETYINQAKQTLHIAYGTTSNGSQIVFGMTELISWVGGGIKYNYNFGGTDGALDFRAYIGNFGDLGIASDLNQDINFNQSYTSWEVATRAYLATNPGVNVIMWAWCYGVNTIEANINTYLSLMEGLESDFPNIKFVYMTGRTMATGAYGTEDAVRNAQIRAYCIAHDKILYDYYDIECYDPDGTYYGDKLVDESCAYDSNADGVRDSNWAINWQNAHPGEWFNQEAPHTQPLSGNLKTYAAWWLWARLAGWDGR